MSELRKVSGVINLTTVRGTRLEYKWPATEGAGRKHLLAMLDEMARLAAVDGAEREARDVVEGAFKRVAEWRKEDGNAGVPEPHSFKEWTGGGPVRPYCGNCGRLRNDPLHTDGVTPCGNTPYDEGPFTLSPLQVTVCELRDGDGTTYLAMLHHVWQRAMDGMCVERRADKAEVEAEAAEWREFLALAGASVSANCTRPT